MIVHDFHAINMMMIMMKCGVGVEYMEPVGGTTSKPTSQELGLEQGLMRKAAGLKIQYFKQMVKGKSR